MARLHVLLFMALVVAATSLPVSPTETADTAVETVKRKGGKGKGAGKNKSERGVFSAAHRFFNLFSTKQSKTGPNGELKYPGMAGMSAIPFLKDYQKMKNWWCAPGKGHESDKSCAAGSKVNFLAGKVRDIASARCCHYRTLPPPCMHGLNRDCT
jgi:hypothetical protein